MWKVNETDIASALIWAFDSGALKKYGQVVKVLDSCFGDCGFKPQWSQLFCWFNFFFNSRTPVTPEITLKSPLFVESVEASILGWVPFCWSCHRWLNSLLLKLPLLVESSSAKNDCYCFFICTLLLKSSNSLKPTCNVSRSNVLNSYYISSTHI